MIQSELIFLDFVNLLSPITVAIISSTSYIALYNLYCPLHMLLFRILYQEIDYINEGKNADRFRRDFRNIKWVRVPVCFLLQY